MSDAARILENYRRSFARIGEDIAVRRFSGPVATRTHVDTSVRARVMGYAPEELVGSIMQGDRKVIILADDALSALLPIRTSDKLYIRGREVAIKGVDDNTRRVAGTLIALEIQAAG